jgi:DNA-binding transcriptional LysR family regulator
VPPRLYVESLGAVPKLVIDGVCALGITGWMPDGEHGLAAQALGSIKLVCVCAPGFPLAQMRGPIPNAVLRDHVQLVLTDRSALTAGRDLFVLATRTWRLADLGAKHAMLLSGLGWGNMPRHIVDDDLAAGRLVAIRPAEHLPRGGDGLFDLPVKLVRRADRALGPATRWIADFLALRSDRHPRRHAKPDLNAPVR